MIKALAVFAIVSVTSLSQAFMLRDAGTTFRCNVPKGWEIESRGNHAVAFNYPRSKAIGKGALPAKGAELTFELYDLNDAARSLGALRSTLRLIRVGGDKTPTEIRSFFDASKDYHLYEMKSIRRREPGTAIEIMAFILEYRTAMVIATVYADDLADTDEISRAVNRLLREASVSREE